MDWFKHIHIVTEKCTVSMTNILRKYEYRKYSIRMTIKSENNIFPLYLKNPNPEE